MSKPNLLYLYKNGNSEVKIFDNGTRHISYPDNEKLRLDFPLNIDIRLMSKCPLGYNPKTGKAVCSFCHESARVDGDECDYDKLLAYLDNANLPPGIEIAIGINIFTNNLFEFLLECKKREFIVNATINQYALNNKDNLHLLKLAIKKKLLKGIGVSYRNHNFHLPDFLENYEHLIVHVIVGIDSIFEIVKLKKKNVKKILLLGEKDFGFNKNKVDLFSKKHKHFKHYFTYLSKYFNVVSFDNLALQQLNLKNRMIKNDFSVFYQHEYSLYINAVEECCYPSSRTNSFKNSFSEKSLRDYFNFLNSLIKIN